MSNKSEKKQNIVFYSKKFFQLLADKFENNISYRYKLLIIKNEKNNQYSVNLAIDTDNNGNKNKIAYFTYKNFEKLDRKKQLEYMWNLYNAEILEKKRKWVYCWRRRKRFFTNLWF